MKTEEWVALVVFLLSFIIGCEGYSDDGPDRGDDDYQEISRSINGVAL